MNIWEQALVSNLVISASMALVAWGVSRSRRWGSVAFFIWLLALIKLAVPPIWHAPVLSAPDRAIVTEIAFWPEISEAPGASVEDGGPDDVELASEKNGDVPAPAVSGGVGAESSLGDSLETVGDSEADQLASLPARFRFSAQSIALALWGLGVVFWAGLGALRWIRFRRELWRSARVSESMSDEANALAREIGLSRRPEVYSVDAPISPILWPNLRRPIIVIPEQLAATMSDGERACLFAHELGHFARRDTWRRVFEFAMVAVYWWYPVAWLARRELHRLEDQRCDAWALERANLCRADYAEALLKSMSFVSKRSAPMESMVCGFTPRGKKEVSERFTSILEKNMRLKLSKKQWAGILALAVALGPISGVTTRAQSEDSSDTENESLSEFLSAEQVEAKARSTSAIEALKAQLAMIDAEIEKLEKQLTEASDRLPGAFQYIDDINIRELRPNPGSAAELDRLVQLFRKAKEKYDAAYSLRRLLESKKDPNVRIQILLAKNHDPNLSELIGRKYATEQQLVVLERTLTPENPKVQETKALLETIDSQIDSVVKGIMAAMESDLEIANAQLAQLTKAIIANTSGASFRFVDERMNEFADVSRKLQYQRSLRDAIEMRLRREKVDAAIPRPETIHKTLMIDRKGRLTIEGERVEKGELIEGLRLDPEASGEEWRRGIVTLKAHPKTPFEVFQEIYQLCRDAGVQVMIATDR